jgi:4-hydroxy-tetrahydrodipicolinate reductase
VQFTLDGETIELAHRADDRGIFARGALEAGLWLVRQPAGFYSAADWLAAHGG